jgi:hypothetical protein
MRIYYLNSEYATGKHKIMKVWAEFLEVIRPEDSPKTAINVPHSVLEIDEKFNRLLAKQLLQNERHSPLAQIPDRYYVDNTPALRDEFGILVTINPNPQKEAWLLSSIHGMTQAQLETYIDSNVTTLASAKEYLKKLSAVTLWLVKQSGLE